MDEMITMSINLHLLIISATVFLALYNIYTTFFLKDEKRFINRMKYIQPLYLSLVSVIVFTGITVMAVNHFAMKPTLFLMMIAVIIIYATSIKKHIIRKNAHTDNSQSMSVLRAFVKKKYSLDIALMITVVIISFVWRA